MLKLVGVKFKKACRIYDFKAGSLELRPGDMVVVEVDKGLGMGSVAYGPREVDVSRHPRQFKKVLRKADQVDLERHSFNSEREEEALRICREKAARYKLPMKVVRVEYLFDSSKAIFYFTSETRVDFRELVKDLAGEFHTRIEMRQIGVRDEAKMLGGMGPCGRVLCCSSYLADFEPVTIKMAKEQNLALNPVKISGICGRLMCCLSYEHGMYKEERRAKAASKEGGCNGCAVHEADKAPKGAATPGPVVVNAEAPGPSEATASKDRSSGNGAEPAKALENGDTDGNAGGAKG